MKVTGMLTLAGGGTMALPTVVDYRFSYGEGRACDSCALTCLPEDWSRRDMLRQAVRLTATAGGKLCFTGVVDEIFLEETGEGRRLQVHGRSMAALLLDNEAGEIVYPYATWRDVLVGHVQPYGLQVDCPVSLPPVADFSVPSGSSEWAVLRRFCYEYGGQKLRVDECGVLRIGAAETGRVLAVGAQSPVTRLGYRWKRFGCVSEVLAFETGEPAALRVENAAFLALGGKSRKRILLPKGSGSAERLRAAQRVIDESMEEAELMELALPFPFAAGIGDAVELQNLGLRRRVSGARITPGESRLVLR